MKRKVFIELKNIVQFILREIYGSMTPFQFFCNKNYKFLSNNIWLQPVLPLAVCVFVFCCRISLKDLSWLMPTLDNQGNYFKNGTTLF